jgi:endonuclease NucS-like protein
VPSGKPLWELICDAAEELERDGRVPFTRRDIAERIRRSRPEVKDSSLAPMIQGVTVNLKGGSPGGVGKEILRSVGRGLFELNGGPREEPIETGTQREPMPPLPAGERSLDEPGRFHLSFETDLQRFLERNPSAIEPGLERVEREVNVEGGGRIDILCRDTEDSLVVVELKIGKADDRTLGQVHRYVGWITKTRASPGQGVRGVIVAEIFDQRLRYSTVGTSTRLLTYRVDVGCREAWPKPE